MPRKTKGYGGHGLTATRLTALLCILLCMSSKRAGPEAPRENTSIFERFAGSLTTAKSLFSFTEKKFSNFLLVDSVVSIFSAYFVDENAGSEQVLLAKLVETLNTYADVSARSSVKNIWLEVHAKKTRIPLPKKLSVTRVSNILIKASTFIDQNAPDLFKQSKKQYMDHNGAVIHILNDTLASLDPHSVVLSPELYRELIEGTEGSFGGLGIVVGVQNSVLTVIKTLNDSPASMVSIKKGDRIVSIDGFDTYGLKLDELIKKMRGPPNSSVDLKVLGSDSIRPKMISLRRKKIDVASTELSLEKTSNGRHYAKIYLEHFSNRTSEEVEANLDYAQRKLGDKLSGIVLDLRGNPGGLLDQAVLVADLFVNKGNIVITKGRSDEEIEFASSYQRFAKLPILVLMNHESASASEILAGALQDHDRAVVIGQRSFGKGSVQTIFELPGSMAMKITIAKYFTPSKKQIQGQGIVPDIWTEFVQGKGENLGPNTQRLKLGRKFLRKNPSVFPSYYYTKAGKNLDYELSYARKLLDKKSVPAKVFSADKFLSERKLEISSLSALASKETNHALLSAKSVDWNQSSGGKSRYLPHVKLNLTKFYTNPGKWVKIPYSILNAGRGSGTRVSVYLYERGKIYSTQEQLVGIHRPGKVVRGAFKIRIPGQFSLSQMNLKIGIASGVDPIPGVEKNVVVQVNPAEEPKLDYSYKLVGENKTKDGSLELGEKAALEIELWNRGKKPVDHINLGLTNLSGKQLQSKFRKNIGVTSLSAGKSKKLYIDLKAASSLDIRDLELVMKMDAGGLKRPLFKVLKVKTRPILSNRKIPLAH